MTIHTLSRVKVSLNRWEKIYEKFSGNEINKHVFLERIRVAVESGNYTPFDQVKTLLDFVSKGQDEGWLEKPEPELEPALSDLILHCEGSFISDPYFDPQNGYSLVSSNNPSGGKTSIEISPDHCTVRIDSETMVSLSFGYYHHENELIVFYIDDKFAINAEE